MSVAAGWTRLEGLTRDASLAEGLAARTADPLWLLARQWQFGGFHGEDAASPAWVTIRGQSNGLTRYLPNLPDGTTAPAWVYFYNAPLGQAPRIPSGDYLEHVKVR